MAEQQSAPDRLDINGNPITAAPDRLDAQGNPVTAREPDFKAHAEIPTLADFEAAKTPNQKMALLKSLPLPNDPQILGTVKDLFNKWVAYGPHAVVQGIKDAIGGEYAKGAHQVITGAATTAAAFAVAPMARAALAAPGLAAANTAAAVGGGYVGQQVGERGAKALGASPDQANLAGDIGGMLGGGAAVSKVSGLLAAREAGQAVTAKVSSQAMSDLMAAIPPTKSAPYRPNDLQRARPYLEAVHASEPITSVQTLKEAADTAIQDIENHIGQYVGVNKAQVIGTNPVQAATTALKDSPRTDALKAGLAELKSLNLDRPLTLPEADAARKQLNAENKGIQKRNNYDIATARQVDPGYAAREAAAAALRDGIYSRLEGLGVPGVAEMRRDEGALIAIRNAAERQIYAGEKIAPGTKPTGLKKAAGTFIRSTSVAAGSVLGTPGAVAGSMVGDELAKAVVGSGTTRDAMIERAFQRVLTKGPQYPAVPAAPAVPDVQSTGVIP